MLILPVQDASEEFETEGFCVEGATAYRSRMGYKEVPAADENSTRGKKAGVPQESLPMFVNEDSRA